ncbi:MAG: hypothetical protein QOG52_2773 [Frankiaceae bacterium]|nr:hypothetical protein [Frankiaceae bacterium]
MTDLRDHLSTLVESEPAYNFSAESFVGSGRRALRRRRVVAGVVGGTLAAAIAVTAVLAMPSPTNELSANASACGNVELGVVSDVPVRAEAVAAAQLVCRLVASHARVISVSVMMTVQSGGMDEINVTYDTGRGRGVLNVSRQYGQFAGPAPKESCNDVPGLAMCRVGQAGGTQYVVGSMSAPTDSYLGTPTPYVAAIHDDAVVAVHALGVWDPVAGRGLLPAGPLSEESFLAQIATDQRLGAGGEYGVAPIGGASPS